MLEIAPYLVTLLAVVAGAFAQRLVGMGFGMVVTPLVAATIGPLAAIMLVNLFGAITCAFIVPRVWRDIDWRAFAWMVIPAIVGLVPGMWLASVADRDVLRVAIGVIALIGVVIAIAVKPAAEGSDTRALQAGTGVTIGVLNAGVGLGATIVGLYALLSGREHRSFAATMQPFWMTLSGAYMGLWAATGGQGAPDWPWWAWILIGIPVVLGAFAGDWLAPRVDARIARLVIILISIAGGVIVLTAGLAGLLSR